MADSKLAKHHVPAVADQSQQLSWSSIEYVLQHLSTTNESNVADVSTITAVIRIGIKASRSNTEKLQRLAGRHTEDPLYFLHDWHTLIRWSSLELVTKQMVGLALAIAFVRSSREWSSSILPADLDLVWGLVFQALTTSVITETASRSAQGFLAVPLWSLVENGNLQELIRFHVWLDDGNRGNPQVGIHSHQPFAQSWILAGQGRDRRYRAEPSNKALASHARYEVSWTDSEGQETGQSYQTRQKFSKIVNTGQLFLVTPESSEVHSRNMQYSVPAGAFHNTEVAPDIVHSTLFFFDAQRGFEKDAPVLGPMHEDSFTQQRDPAGVSPSMLAQVVDSVRKWEVLCHQALQHELHAEWEEALHALRSALAIYEHNPIFPKSTSYKYTTLGAIGHIERMLGRYEKASEVLEMAIAEMPHNEQRVNSTGELAVVYRHSNRLEDAKRVCEEQYKTAKHIHSNQEMCRAVGNLGMVNYQLYLLTKNPEILDIAIGQIQERVERARQLRQVSAGEVSDPIARAHLVSSALTREAIGLARLSLCYSEKQELKKALDISHESLRVITLLNDSTKMAFSRFFYGRALLLNGRKEEALAQFNPPNTCTPSIAFCKEPSDEHCEYIQLMIDAGADLELRDEQGYSALDCAVYSGHTLTQQVVERGLRQKLGIREVDLLLSESRIRKGYRELFQDRLRPILLQAGDQLNLVHLRQVYADTLTLDDEKSTQFDALKFVHLTDFKNHGKIPKSTDGLTRQFISGSDNSSHRFIIFISYRWVNGARIENFTPDNAENIQYKRIIRAVDGFLRLHPGINPDQVSLWLVS